ncbi:MAG: hypothetical protein IT256_01845 [Chitinophagaceae bacterium]|nr:hypothetical protein [Chitinophagaceae bacterium]
MWCKRLIYVGLLAGAYAIFAMIFKNPRPDVATFHIIYKIDKKYLHELFFIPYQAVYILSTVAPMFLSSLRGVKLLAYANFIALIFCFYLFQLAMPSTWCFFAAFLSSIIYYILWKKNNTPTTVNYKSAS